MSDRETYFIISTGGILADFTEHAVAMEFAELFEISPKEAMTFLASPKLINKDLNRADADAYVEKLTEMGVPVLRQQSDIAGAPGHLAASAAPSVADPPDPDQPDPVSYGEILIKPADKPTRLRRRKPAAKKPGPTFGSRKFLAICGALAAISLIGLGLEGPSSTDNPSVAAAIPASHSPAGPDPAAHDSRANTASVNAVAAATVAGAPTASTGEALIPGTRFTPSQVPFDREPARSLPYNVIGLWNSGGRSARFVNIERSGSYTVYRREPGSQCFKPSVYTLTYHGDSKYVLLRTSIEISVDRFTMQGKEIYRQGWLPWGKYEREQSRRLNDLEICSNHMTRMARQAKQNRQRR